MGCDVSAKTREGTVRTRARRDHILVGIRNLVLDGALIIDPSTVGAPAFLTMGFDIVVAKLTNLAGRVSGGPDREPSPDRRLGRNSRTRGESVPDTHRGKA